MPTRAACLLMLAVLGVHPARAADDDLSASKIKIAKVVALVRLGAILCLSLEPDEEAIHHLMDQASVTDRDVVDPKAFGSGSTIIQRSFVQSFLSDPGGACSGLYGAFGPGKGQLLRLGGKPT